MQNNTKGILGKLTEEDIDKIFTKDISILELLDSAAVLIAVADKNGMLVRLNKRWKTVLGYEEEELTAKPFISFVHPDDIKKTVEVYYEGHMFNEGAEMFEGFTNRYKTKDGRWANLEWYSAGSDVNGLSLSIAIFRGYDN